MVAIVKQANVPPIANCLQKFQQCSGTLRKFKAQNAFIPDIRCYAANHVPNMERCNFVVSQVENRVSAAVKLLNDFLCFARAMLELALRPTPVRNPTRGCDSETG